MSKIPVTLYLNYSIISHHDSLQLGENDPISQVRTKNMTDVAQQELRQAINAVHTGPAASSQLNRAIARCSAFPHSGPRSPSVLERRIGGAASWSGNFR